MGKHPPPLDIRLHIDKLETTPTGPKCVIKRSMHNSNSRATHYYSIVENLDQNPCVMLALEALHNFPLKRNPLLVSVGARNLSSSSTIKFDTANVQPLFPHHVYFHVHVECLNKTIKHMVIDECTSTLVM